MKGLEFDSRKTWELLNFCAQIFIPRDTRPGNLALATEKKKKMKISSGPTNCQFKIEAVQPDKLFTLLRQVIERSADSAE